MAILTDILILSKENRRDVMKINLHVDASISEEHAEIWVKQMKPNLESMLQYLNNNQVLWCYYDDQLKPISLNDIFYYPN